MKWHLAVYVVYNMAPIIMRVHVPKAIVPGGKNGKLYHLEGYRFDEVELDRKRGCW
jgi:hypothetical protein